MRYIKYILIVCLLVALAPTSMAQGRSLKNTDRYWEIGAGEISRFTTIFMNGRNPDVDTGSDPEDVWNYGAVQTYMTTAAALYVSSSAAANDDDQVIVISGIDENWDLQTATVTPTNRTQVIVPPGNNSSMRKVTFASVTTGPGAGAVITQAVSGAQLSVVGSSTADNTIWGVLVGATEFVGVNTVTGGALAPSPATPTTITLPCSLWLRVNSVVQTSANALTGDLYVAELDTLTTGVPNTATKVHSKIDIGRERAQGTHFSVPRNHTAYIMHGFIANNDFEDTFARMAIYRRNFGGLFQVFNEVGTRSSFQMELATPFEVAAQSDIKMVCIEVEADSTDVSAGYILILEDDRGDM